MNYAFIKNNLVGNIVDESKVDKCPADHTPVQLADGEKCGIFWLYDENQTPRFIQQPSYNPNTQDLQVNDNNGILEWQIVSKSVEEINRYLDSVDAQIDALAIKRLLQKVVEPVIADEANLTEQDIADAAVIYPYYRPDKAYSVPERFNYNGQLYEVVQAHTSQSDWIPDEVPALYKKFTPAGQVSEWVQPTGAQDAYQIGDKVSFDGSIYESVIDNNVWSPTAYPAGWKKL